jgi:hypothetical protein
MRSPFEEASVFSFGLFNKLVNNVDLSTNSREYGDVVDSTYSMDITSMLSGTLHLYPDSNYVTISYIILLHVLAYYVATT